jgi:hypothetical protein
MLNSRAVVCLLALTLSACNGRSPTAPAPSVSGTWQGIIVSGPDGPGTMTVDLAQSGRDLSGPAHLSQGTVSDALGSLTGTLETTSLPTSMQVTVTYVYGFACHGSFSGTLNVTDGVIEGSYSGQNCVQPFTGTLRLTRHN